MFYFNFKEYITSLINTNNFKDLVNPVLDIEAPNSFSYEGFGFFKNPVTIRIIFTDTTNESVTKSLRFLASVEQLDSYKKNEVQTGENTILSPLAVETNNHYYVKYWEGYPFDVSFLQTNYPTLIDVDIVLTNLNNLLSYTFTTANNITRLFFCDGNTDESLNDLLPIALGQNEIQWLDKFLIIDKQDVCEGVYLKWYNNYGGFNYWKFDNIFKKAVSTKSIGEIVTDFDNLNETFSNTSEVGKAGIEKIQVNTDSLTDNELRLLKPLLTSPKVYLFVNQPFARATANDWLEVKITSTSYAVRNYKEQPVALSFDIEMPDLYTQNL